MKKCKRLIAFVCIFAMLFSMVGYADTTPAKGNDITGHWAAKDLTEWLAKGYITADAAGLVKPDSVITRAEFANYVNKAFKFAEKASINFTDVKPADVYADDVAKAVKAGYMVGNGDGTWKPNATITRQEVAVLLARLLGLDDTSNGLAFAGFADKAKVAAWATNSVIAVSANNYMTGDGKKFNPLSNITKAEAVALLSRADEDYYTFIIKTPGIVNTPKLNGSVYVKANNVEIKDTEITGNLVVGKEIGDGDFTLRDSVVKGNIIINGGGVNSIHLINVVVGNVIVQRANGNVRVGLEGRSNITNLSVLTPASLQVAAQSAIAALALNSPTAITGTGTIKSTAINTKGVTSTIKLLNVTGSVGNAGISITSTTTTTAGSSSGGSGSGGSSGGSSGGGTSNLGTISISAINKNVAVGNSVLPSVTVNPADATLTYTSLNTDIATVDPSTGRINGITSGTATIRVDAVKSRYTGKSTTFNVVVGLLEWSYYDDTTIRFKPLKITDAASIKIEQSDDNGTTWKDSNIDKYNKYRVVNLTPNTKYSFRLKIQGGKYEGYSNIVTITTESNLNNLELEEYSQTTASLIYPSITDATKGYINISTLDNAELSDKWIKRELTATEMSSGKITVNNLNPNTEYYIHLYIEGGHYAGTSNWVYVLTPSNDILVDTYFEDFKVDGEDVYGYVTNREVKLLFADSTGKPYIPANGSKVEYSIWGEEGEVIISTPTDGKPYLAINGLDPNTDYHFRLVVPTGNANAGISKVIYITTQGNIQNLKCIDSTKAREARFTLSATETDMIEVILEKFVNGDWVPVYAETEQITSTTTSFKIFDLEPRTEYWLQLYVYDGSNEGRSNGIIFVTAEEVIVPVTSITVSGNGGATTVTNGEDLYMLAEVNPGNATNKAVTWSVTNGTGSAVIDASTGLLQAKGVGTVTVTATNAASGVTGTKVITVTEADKIAPTLSSGTVENLGTETGTTAILKYLATPEEGTVKSYYLVQNASQSPPDIAAIKASSTWGTNSGNPIYYQINLTGLTAGENYTTYIVMEDASGNTSNILTITEIKPYVLTTVEKTILINSITAANTNKATVVESIYGDDVLEGDDWVLEIDMSNYTNAIAVAQTVADNAAATQAEVDDAVAELAIATTTFNGVKKPGTKVVGP